MAELNTVIPVAWNALINALCREAPYLRATLIPEVARFTQARLACSGLAAAFNTSLLAYNGCPLEFTVSTSKPQALACTLDPFLPYCAEDLRIEAFSRHYRQIVAPVSQNDADIRFDAAARMQNQSAQPLRFGSWLGRKYTPEGVKTKIYSEVQSGGFDETNWPGAVENLSAAACREAGLSLLMVGEYPQQPVSPREYYFQWHSAHITHADIAAVMRFYDCESLWPALKPLLEQAVKLTLNGQAFPPTTYGFSLVYGQDAGPESFTLFVMAESFFGDNQRVFPGIQTLLTQNDLQLPLLQQVVTEQIPVQFNVVGFSVDRQGRRGISCTFSPQNKRFETLPVKQTPPSVHTCRVSLKTLLAQQSASGAFTSHVRTPDGRWHQDENAFVTAQVLRTLEHTAQTAPHIEKALDFLTTCETRPHHFSFWPSAAHPQWMANLKICADIDDTAIITELLYKSGRLSLTQVRQTLSHMNSYQVRKVDPRMKAGQHQWAECQSFYTWMQDENELTQLDCCVNTNALILLHVLTDEDTALPPAYPRILQMLNQALEWSGDDYDRLSALTPYYAHPGEWHTTLMYARDAGIPQLTPLINALSRWRLPAGQRESPLYRRHDGRYLWTSPCLNAFRSLAHTEYAEGNYEYIS
ncbi:hypothetical protein [Rahnella laticis]|uniref:hypothetical protein n=1 Tax=Rahnella laticis TaxID=2787622 RepID=UPI0018A25C25|nr:hypothetical protein [Rahnella laticis]MBF7995144.1 hypothetical protein [Rahnella laticis]